MPRFTTSDGLSLHYEDSGEGKPLICLPGLTRNTRDFDWLDGHLPGVRRIALDARGRGQSEHDPDFLNYNLLRESHDALELLDHLGLDRVTVLGTSRGGLVAMALAASHPERLSGVILNDVGPVIGPAGIARIMDYLGRKPGAADLDGAARDLQAGLGAQFPGLPRDRWRAMADAQYRVTPDGLDLTYDPHLRTATLEQSASGAMPDLWLFFDALRSIPTALIHGVNSDVLLPETVEAMQRRHPGLIVAEVPDRGHAPFLDEPESLHAIRAILEHAE